MSGAVGTPVGGDGRVGASPGRSPCAHCGRRVATKAVELGKARSGAPLTLRVCDECVPDAGEVADGNGAAKKLAKPRRRKTKNRLAATDYAVPVSAVLYRLGGCTLEQAGRWLYFYMPDHFASKSGSYEAAKRTLCVMREQGQVEVVSIRRTWTGKRTGRRENFYRLARARSGAAILEGAIAADEDPKYALSAYRRPWKSGGIDHAAHRSDLYLLYAEEALGSDDVYVDPERMYSETHPAFPFYGAKTIPTDSGGERLKLKKTARRKYEEVTPDGEFFGEFTFASGDGPKVIECPYLLELERRTNSRIVEEKIQKYAGYWLRRLETFGEVLLRPILIVHHDTRPVRARGRRQGSGAVGLRDALAEGLPNETGGHYAALSKLLALAEYGGVSGVLGQMFLFADWETLYESNDPFGIRYYPVAPYTTGSALVGKDGMTVRLAAAALQREIGVRKLGESPKVRANREKAQRGASR